MRRSLVVVGCLIALLGSPVVFSAEGASSGAAVVASTTSPAVISIRDLQIPGKARLACNKGTKRFIAKNPAASIPEFQKAIKIFPKYYEAYAKMGAAEMELEHWDDAEANFRKSIELSAGRYAPADFGLALILTTVKKRYSEAEPILRAELELNPTDETGHFVLAWLLYSTNRLPEAEQAAREAALADPAFAGARLLLAQIHLLQKKPAEVVEDLNSYLALGVSGPMDHKMRALRDQAQRDVDHLDGPSAGIEVVQTR